MTIKKEITLFFGKIILMFLILTFAFLPFIAFSSRTIWHSPTDATGTNWVNHENTYDENLNTYANMVVGTVYPIVLHWGGGEIDSIRFYADYVEAWHNTIEIDVFYEGGWHNVYPEGSYADLEWVEVEIPEGLKWVSKARVEVYSDSTPAKQLTEFDFGSPYYLLPFTFGDLATSTAYIGDVLESIGFLVYFGCGIPLAFYVIRKIVRLFKK